jgi:hypothetical protein
LPKHLDGLTVQWTWDGRPLEIRYRVLRQGFAPFRIALNGEALALDRRVVNPYREGGARLEKSAFESRLRPDANLLEIEM